MKDDPISQQTVNKIQQNNFLSESKMVERNNNTPQKEKNFFSEFLYEQRDLT